MYGILRGSLCTLIFGALSFFFHVTRTGSLGLAVWLAVRAPAEQVKLGQAALREKEELDTKWVEILLAAKAERADLESRSAAMRGRGAVLRERRARLQDEVDRGRAQLVAAAAGDGRCVRARARARTRVHACGHDMIW